MAFATPAARGSAVDIVSDNTIAMNPSAAIAVGRFLVVGCSTKNLQTTDGASNDHSTVADSKNNVWTKHEERTETAGVAADGTTVSLWSTRVTTQIETTDTITLTTSAAIAEKIITAVEVQCAAGMQVALAQVGLGPNAISASVSGLVSREYFLFGVFGAEGSDTAKAPDADYTECHDLRSRNNAAAITIHTQTRIATLTADTCTSTLWTNTDPYALLAAFYETPLVAVPVGATTLAGQTPKRVMNHIAAVGVCALALAGASMGVRFTGPETGALTLAGQAPTVVVGGGTETTIAVPVGSLALEGQAPSLRYDLVSAPGVGSLSLAGQAPSLGLTNPVPSGALSLAGLAPTISIGGSNTDIPVPVGALALAGQAPLIGHGITVPVGALTLTGTLPSIAFFDPPPAALVLNGLAPTLSISGGSNTTIAVPVGALALSGTSMDVAFPGPETGALVFSGLAPTISIGGSNTTIAVPVGALALNGLAPAIRYDLVSAPPVGSLSLAGLAPTISIGGGSPTINVPTGALTLTGTYVGIAFINPAPGTLVLTGLAPTVLVAAGTNNIAVPVGALALNGLAPTVPLDIGRAVPAGALTFAGHAPVASVGSVRAVPVGSLTLTGQAATLIAPVVVQPGVGALTFTGHAPSVGVAGAFNPAWAMNSNQWIGPVVAPQ